MAESKSIERKRGGADGFSFESLKAEGLRLVQEMSGNLWTDYNLHDPGVTILDQLCYALTDLVYRADFPVEDFLTGDDGKMDFGDLALHPPETALPCRPTTMADYRRIIFDRLPGIDDVRLQTAGNGLYRIMIRPGSHEAAGGEELIERVRKVYAGARNLCEDIDGITVVAEETCELHALIEVAGECEPAVILAGIYHACSLHIAAAIRSARFGESLKTGLGLDELLSGPATEHGIVAESDLENDREEIVIADLFTVIRGVAGVNQVKRLWLSKGGRDYFDAIENNRDKAVLRLRIPEGAEEIGVRLESASGRELPVPFREFRSRFNDLDFMRRTLRSSPEDLSSCCPLPGGVRRPFRDYYSIQNQFPAIFGINARGTPESAPPDARGKAAQLKGYLLLFDQIMANYNANLDNIRSLFSLGFTGRESYFCQVVENNGDPTLAEIYPDNPGQVLAALLRRYDPWPDRRGRIMDYLLALYGESFPRNPLRNFNVYAAPHEGDEALLGIQTAFLRSVMEAGRDRGGAFDYTRNISDPGNVSGYKRRISLLLGFGDFQHRRLAVAITRHGLRLGAVPDDGKLSGPGTRSAMIFGEIDVTENFVSIPLTEPAGAVGTEALLSACRGFFPFLGDTLPESLLRSGISLDNFRMADGVEKKEVPVAFRDKESGKWRALTVFPDAGTAVDAVNALRRLCIRLNIESEGVQVVEHILLRPTASARHNGEPVPEDFHPFRMSLLFPAWTARCHDRRFREMAENMVRMNTPAHIYPEIFWLDLETMTGFERLFQDWLQKRAKSGTDPAQLDGSALGLIRFLLSLGGAGPPDKPGK